MNSERTDLTPLNIQPVWQPEGLVGGAAILEVDVELQPSPLDNMPLKELRRLGEKRGIHNAPEMKKKELLVALRKLVVQPTPVESSTDETHAIDVEEIEDI